MFAFKVHYRARNHPKPAHNSDKQKSLKLNVVPSEFHAQAEKSQLTAQ